MNKIKLKLEQSSVILREESSAFGEINLTLLLHLGPIIFQLVMILPFYLQPLAYFLVSVFIGNYRYFLVSFHINKTSSSLFDSMYQQDNQVNSDLIHQISNSYEIKVKMQYRFNCQNLIPH